MDIILLRTLSHKSSLGFGYYGNMTIRQIIDIQKPGYLRWVYYNAEGITFADDILDEIFVHEKDRIKKPGKNPELHTETTAKKFSSLKHNDPAYFKIVSKERKNRKLKLYRKEMSRKKENFSKSILQSKNHGH